MLHAKISAMTDKTPFFITTAIAYVNGTAHIGHALEFIQADAIARYQRQRGMDVHFLTGTDEHGVKIVKTAAEQGMEISELVDANAQSFKDLRETFNLSWDDFIRTTDRERHWPAVTKLWNKLVEAGDLYEKEYEGLYCYGCEEFKKEKDLVDGNCPNHQRPPELVKEKNWFFKLSKYSDQILEKLESREVAIVPERRAKEIINVVKNGLHDVSFSRPVESLKNWGIPVPNDPDQLMYVWCDALTNYASAVDLANEGPDFQKWWPANVHCIGKDIVRFHAGIWIGMLLSAGYALPKQIYVHGFVTSEGQKMSKSLGNVVDPVEVANEWGADALRWYLLSEIPNGQDGDFSAGRFKEKYDAELANSLGNLVSRVIAMAVKQGEEFTISELDASGAAAAAKMWQGVESAMTDYDTRRASLAMLELLDWANGWVNDKEPWKLKDDLAQQQVILGTLLEVIRQAALALVPFLPATADKIAASLDVELTGELEETKKWGAVTVFQLSKPGILFPKKED